MLLCGGMCWRLAVTSRNGMMLSAACICCCRVSASPRLLLSCHQSWRLLHQQAPCCRGWWGSQVQDIPAMQRSDTQQAHNLCFQCLTIQYQYVKQAKHKAVSLEGVKPKLLVLYCWSLPHTATGCM